VHAFRLLKIISNILMMQSDYPSGEQTQVKLFNSLSTNLLHGETLSSSSSLMRCISDIPRYCENNIPQGFFPTDGYQDDNLAATARLSGVS